MSTVNADTVAIMRDFSAEIPPGYRAGYSSWRKGSACGAKGEPDAGAFKLIRHPCPDDLWAERCSPEMKRMAVSKPAKRETSYSASPVFLPNASPSCGPTPADPWDEAPFALPSLNAAAACLVATSPSSTKSSSPRPQPEVTASSVRALPEFSSASADFRAAYGRWRSGEASGAKGEP